MSKGLQYMSYIMIQNISSFLMENISNGRDHTQGLLFSKPV